jgi:acetyltransferase-like isoleucine patch superfamily enzyme
MEYIKRVIAIIYYLFNVSLYRYLNFRATVYMTVRVAGKKYISIDRNTVVNRYGWLLALKIDDYTPELSIGKNCAIGDFSHITAVRKVHIEDDVIMANNVYIADNLHGYEDINTPVINQKVVFKSEVVIKSGSWIGENVCIIGASVGKNSVIGANAVVTKDIPDYCIAVGSPARVIKKYNIDQKAWVSIQ